MTREEAITLIKPIMLMMINTQGEVASDGYYALEMAIKALEQEPKTEWIPVSEKLPKEGEEVLVWYEYDRYGDYNCRWQTCGLGWQRNAHFYVDNDGFKPRVIAWCPLPKPYSEVEQ